MKPKVYIITLNYKNWYDTIECLESVLRNDYPNYQVIVIDNNSPNNSMEYLKAWAEGKIDIWVDPRNPLRNLSYPPIPKPVPYVYYTREEAEKGGNIDLERKLESEVPEGITSKYPLVFIQSGSNLGFAGGNNVGIRYALEKNDFDSVILLNNDAVIKRDAISILASARLKLGEKAIYGGRIYYYSEPDRIWYDGGKFNEWIGRSVHLNMGKVRYAIKNNFYIKEINFVTFCYVLIPKFILENIGLLNETYFMYAEDLEYSYKLWKSGYKIFYLPNSELWHKVSATTGSGLFNDFSAYWMMRSKIKFITSNLSFFKKVISIVFLLIFNMIRSISFYFKGGNCLIKSQLKGFIDGIYAKSNPPC
jgi:GT2 family glycosyltransferase